MLAGEMLASFTTRVDVLNLVMIQDSRFSTLCSDLPKLAIRNSIPLDSDLIRLAHMMSLLGLRLLFAFLGACISANEFGSFRYSDLPELAIRSGIPLGNLIRLAHMISWLGLRLLFAFFRGKHFHTKR